MYSISLVLALFEQRPHVPQRVLEEERHEDEDDVRASIQTAKAE